MRQGVLVFTVASRSIMLTLSFASAERCSAERLAPPIKIRTSAMTTFTLGPAIGAAFLCSDLQLTLDVREDHVSYLGHWLNVLRTDKRAIFTAAAHAQKAADYLHSLQRKAIKATATYQPIHSRRRKKPCGRCAGL